MNDPFRTQQTIIDDKIIAIETAANLYPENPLWYFEFDEFDLMRSGFNYGGNSQAALSDLVRDILSDATSYAYSMCVWDDHSRRVVVVEATIDPPL